MLTWEWEGGVLLRLTFQERQVLDNNRLIACKAKGLHYFKSIIEDQPGSIFTHKSKEKGDHLEVKEGHQKHSVNNISTPRTI